MREAWCLNTRVRKRKRGAASACHLQPYTLSDPGGKYLRTGTRPSTVRQLRTSIEPHMKGDVCRSRRNVLCNMQRGLSGAQQLATGKDMSKGPQKWEAWRNGQPRSLLQQPLLWGRCMGLTPGRAAVCLWGGGAHRAYIG